MNIKKIVKSQSLRHKIMRLGKFIPDRIMLSLQYFVLLGHWPNLRHPQKFSEWIQLYKMSYRNPLILDCVDKYTVRDVVRRIIGNEYLTELYQICEDAAEIDFGSLPKKFVIKTTSGGNGDNVLIVDNKDALNVEETIERVNGWRSKDYSDTSREWAYKQSVNHPRIIVEQYLEHDSTKGIDDYKFFCFNGKCRFFKVDFNRFTHHQANYYSSDGTLIDVEEIPFTPDKEYEIVPYDEIEKMIALAERLAEDFPFVRVDLYNVNGKIYFGELTFYPGSGYSRFSPDTFDVKAGQFFPNLNDPIWTRYMLAGK